MENYLRARVKERLSALGISAFEASRRAGTERTFLTELLRGKKETIRPARLEAVAAALECDPEYLIGAQATPRLTGGAQGGLPLAGICEAGVWRGPDATAQGVSLPVPADPRYPAGRQALYLIRGQHAEALGIRDGDVVVAVADEPVRDGDLVVTRRVREGREQELAVRPMPARAEDVEILARIISSHRAFR